MVVDIRSSWPFERVSLRALGIASSVSLFEVDNLRVSFRTPSGFLPVVRGVSFALEPGETLAIVGESGSGKSVTSLAILGLLSNKAEIEGQFRFQGQPFEPSEGKVRGNGISMVFQNPMSSLNPVMSVGKQVAESLIYLKGQSKSVAAAKSLEIFEEVGLPSTEEFYRSFPHQLSGGMKQRVMIAIALACDPVLLLADEPTTALDVTIQAQILALLKRLQKERRNGLVMVTHDMSVVKAVADRVAVMYAGQLVEVGRLGDVLASPKHPYTQALLRSIPELKREVPERLLAIPGRPPSPSDLGIGCAFAPRCERADHKCRAAAPELHGEEQHPARCFYA